MDQAIRVSEQRCARTSNAASSGALLKPVPVATADQAAEIARLRRENERLRMERDILVLRRPVEPKQYACSDYKAALDRAGIIASMSRRANPLDNAPMESFFHTLKTESVHHRSYATREEAKRDLFSYVERFHTRQRLHSALGYRTPNQAEQQAAHVA